jgi:hypothetical protein
VFDHSAPGGDIVVLNTPSPIVATVTDTTTGGTFFDSAAPAGYQRQSLNLGNEGPDRSDFGTLAALRDGIPVAGFEDLDSNIYLRTHIGSDPSTFQDITSWQPSVTLKGDEPRLAGGPGGVYLIYRPLSGSTSLPYRVRRFNGGKFVGPVIPLTTDPNDQYRDLFEDDSGRFARGVGSPHRHSRRAHVSLLRGSPQFLRAPGDRYRGPERDLQREPVGGR